MAGVIPDAVLQAYLRREPDDAGHREDLWRNTISLRHARRGIAACGRDIEEGTQAGSYDHGLEHPRLTLAAVVNMRTAGKRAIDNPPMPWKVGTVAWMISMAKRMAFGAVLVGVATTLVGSAAGRTVGAATNRVPVATINASTQALSAASGATSTPFPYGSVLNFDIFDASANYILTVPTSGAESLQLLPDGGAAVTVPVPAEVDVGPSISDQSDQAANDAQASDAFAAAADGATAADSDPADAPSDNPDAADYPGGSDVAAPVDGTTIVGSAVSEVDNLAVTAALTPPVARDSTGATVDLALTTTRAGLAISIPRTAGMALPVHVTMNVGFNADYASDPTARQLAHTSASCSSPVDVLISYVTQWQSLASAIVKNPTRCASYFVLVPGVGGTVPRGGSADTITALNTRPRMVNAQASFIPVATVTYGDIPHGQYGTTGQNFGSLLAARHYSFWAIDEAPADLLKGPTDPAWMNFNTLVSALATSDEQGIVEDAYFKQSEDIAAIRSYKHATQTLLVTRKRRTNLDWQTLANETALWGQETYAYCSLVCVNGASLKSMATHTNQYLQHFGRLLFAPDSPSSASPAQQVLKASYLPVTNDWKGGDQQAYQTSTLSLGQMEKLLSLQVYATRVWATADNSYSGSRIGVRWTDNTISSFSTAERSALATRTAQALAGAYAPGASALGACDPAGAVKANCEPRAGGSFTSNWSIFKLWGRSNQSAGCPGAGGTDLAGGPPNDNFDSAALLDSDSGSVDGTLVNATVQVGEPFAADAPATRSTAWYCWTATQTAIDDNSECYPGQVSFFLTSMRDGEVDNLAPSDLLTVWSGTAFGTSLQLVADRAFVHFVPSVGTTYMFQVSQPDVQTAAPDFELRWPASCA